MRGALPSPISVSGFSAAEILDWIAVVTARSQARSIERVAIDELKSDWSPRTGGLDAAHVRRLVEAEGPLPPIYVHRETMQIVDGHHRAAAEAARGSRTISAYLLEGSADNIFIVAVSANVMHGLPLSLADRKSAATKLLQRHPDWSDRAIATATGLAAKTVDGLRGATAEDPQLHDRIGRDGRRRRVNIAEGRRVAAELIAAQPRASLREIARLAGISASTVRDVRARVHRGEPAVPAVVESPKASQPDALPGEHAPATSVSKGDVSELLAALAKDPSLHMTDAGKVLMSWLSLRAIDSADGTRLIRDAPDHSLERLIEFAERCSRNWARLAERVRIRIISR